MATHSSILAWRIPRTEEPGGLQSIGSQRVRHDWSGLGMHMEEIHHPVNCILRMIAHNRLQAIIPLCLWVLVLMRYHWFQIRIHHHGRNPEDDVYLAW